VKIKLKATWSRAKTNKDGRIIGWDDFKPGDEVDVDKDTAEALIATGIAEKVAQKQAKKSKNKQAKPAENKEAKPAEDKAE